MSDGSMREDTDKSYWPDDIAYVPGRRGKPGHHIDPSTGLQTYPSWAKRSERTFIHPSDMDMDTHSPTGEDLKLERILTIALGHQDVDAGEGVKTDVIIEIIKRELGIGHRAAYQRLYSLWQAGLIEREGALDLRSKRPMNQLWYL